MSKTRVNVQTQEEYNKLMRLYEATKRKWKGNKENPTELNIWRFFKEKTCINTGTTFNFVNIEDCKRLKYTIITFKQFLAAQHLTEADIPAANP